MIHITITTTATGATQTTREILDGVGLEGRLHHLPRELSGGEPQRLGRMPGRWSTIPGSCPPTSPAPSTPGTINRECGPTIPGEDRHRPCLDRIVRIGDGAVVSVEEEPES